MNGRRIRLALPLLGRGVWTGGYVYLKNTLRLIKMRLGDRVEALVFLSPSEYDEYGAELTELVDGRVIVDRLLEQPGRGASLIRALFTGKVAALERILSAAKVDVVFENAAFYGSRFAIPVISWIPDFQHRHLPGMFPTTARWRRELGFQMQIRCDRTIMLSSESALSDLEGFYPLARGRAHIVRFAMPLDIQNAAAFADKVREHYDLPERFFFLPNQFWRHKNHKVVVDALALLAKDGQLSSVPPIVLTGLPKDSREPAHFERLFARVRHERLDNHFKYLGLVPYEHVLALNAACHAMINPSLFEGWSTPIEEAKALGTPLILSDLPIHREQSAGALHFDPHCPRALSNALLIAATSWKDPRPTLTSLISSQEIRLQDHASSLLRTLEAAVYGSPRPPSVGRKEHCNSGLC